MKFGKVDEVIEEALGLNIRQPQDSDREYFLKLVKSIKTEKAEVMSRLCEDEVSTADDSNLKEKILFVGVVSFFLVLLLMLVLGLTPDAFFGWFGADRIGFGVWGIVVLYSLALWWLSRSKMLRDEIRWMRIATFNEGMSIDIAGYDVAIDILRERYAIK